VVQTAGRKTGGGTRVSSLQHPEYLYGWRGTDVSPLWIASKTADCGVPSKPSPQVYHGRDVRAHEP